MRLHPAFIFLFPTLLVALIPHTQQGQLDLTGTQDSHVFSPSPSSAYLGTGISPGGLLETPSIFIFPI